MIKKVLILIIVCFILVAPAFGAVYADSAGGAKSKNLSLDEAIHLALANYSDLKLANWAAAENDAQLSYIAAAKKKLEDEDVNAEGGLLPVSSGDFLKSIPNYDQLSDEDKTAIQQSITLQIMINTSINQWIQAQTASQNSYNQELKNSQLKEYSDQLRSLESNQLLYQFEVQNTEALIRYDVIQKYYQLTSSQLNIEYLKKDQQYWNTQVVDALLLYNNGLISKQELEEAQDKAHQQETALKHDEQSLQAQKDLFKQELGLSAFSDIILTPPALPSIPNKGNINAVYDPRNSLELKKEDTKVKLAEANYDAIADSEPELKNYYQVLWSSQLEQRNAVQQQLEKQFTKYKAEANDLCQRNIQIKEEHVRLVQSLQDIQTLNSKGLATLAEVDNAVRQLNQSNQQMDSLKYEYLIFMEKVQLVVNGITV